MARLGILGGYKKQSRDPNRGEDIFGAASMANGQTRRESAEFLQCLLTYIRTWSQRYGKLSDGSLSVYSQTYIHLTNQGVTFPPSSDPPHAVVQSRAASSVPRGIIQPLTQAELEVQSNTAQLLNSLLENPNPDLDTMAEMNTELSTFLLRVERELNLKTGQVGMEDYISQLFEMNDFIRQTLEKYEKFRLTRLGPARSPLSAQAEDVYIESEEQELQLAMAASLHPSMSAPSESELQQKQSTLHNLQEELSKTRQEAMDYARAAEQRKELAGRLKAEGERDLQARELRYNQELQSTMSLMTANSQGKGQLMTAKNSVEVLKKQLSDKENEHRTILKALTSVQAENLRLKQALSKEFSQSSVYASQDFATIRSSGSVPSSGYSGERSLPGKDVDNAVFMRNAMQINKGLVYSDHEIEVGFLCKQPGLMLMYVGNKSQSELHSLQTYLTDSPLEGLRLTINKDREDQPLAFKSKVNRSITIEKSGVFTEIPKMQITYQ